MTAKIFHRYNSLVEEISRDPLSADLLLTIFAAQVGAQFEDKRAPHPNGKTVEEIIQSMPPMQQLASYSNDEQLIQAIGTDAAEILHFAILDSPSAYICLPESEEVASLRIQNPTENHPKCYQFKVIESPPGKEQIFQAIKSKYNSTRYLWHGSSADRWFRINQFGLLSTSDHPQLMVTGSTLGTGIYLAPSSTTSTSYSREFSNKYTNSQLGKKIKITALCEVINLPEKENGTIDVQVNNQTKTFAGKLSFHDWTYTLTLPEACIIRYLFVNLDADVNLDKDQSLLDSLK